MINSNTLPQQILVIDENQAWLNSVTSLNVEGFCCIGKTSFDVFNFIQDRVHVLTTIVLNANMVSHFDESRYDFLGVKLLNEILQKHFPQMKFYLLSFTYSKDEQEQIANFTDFLNYLSQHNGCK